VWSEICSAVASTAESALEVFSLHTPHSSLLENSSSKELLPPKYPYTYLYNISNRLSRQFYGETEETAYELKGGKGPIMQCRHCIRYSLGYCVKRGGQQPTWHEPLSLVLGDGRHFRLEFDCKNCQMNVYAACGLNDE
jgi:putative protease